MKMKIITIALIILGIALSGCLNSPEAPLETEQKATINTCIYNGEEIYRGEENCDKIFSQKIEDSTPKNTNTEPIIGNSSELSAKVFFGNYTPIRIDLYLYTKNPENITGIENIYTGYNITMLRDVWYFPTPSFIVMKSPPTNNNEKAFWVDSFRANRDDKIKVRVYTSGNTTYRVIAVTSVTDLLEFRNMESKHQDIIMEVN